jgi:glycosyltransferase involved in cell wall biosynthesis
VVIANGVDLERFQPAFLMTEPMTEPCEPELSHKLESRRLLFIGSFAHRPNVLAMQFFLREVFPLLKDVTLHVIAGRRHEAFFDLRHAGVEVEGFVSDVRPAYRRATLVIAPLVASAGTNIKIMEAMAMGKAIVSTEAGIHGLDLKRGEDLIVANSAEEMAGAIARLLDRPEERRAMERHARETAEQLYGWDAIARRQAELYQSLLREVSR